MKYKKFVRIHSYSRILKYYKATGGNRAKTIMLYNANIKIAQALHPLLGITEIILRNQIHYALAKYFNDSNWIINQKKGFMIHPSLTYKNKKTGKTVINNYLLKEIEKAEKKLIGKGANKTSGRIIAEQTFGFWNSFYEVHHYRILQGVPGSIFKNLPKGYGRKNINDTLATIRELRNRINHNEPICFVNGKQDFSYTRRMHNTIVQFLSWIDPDILSTLGEIDKVQKTINKEEEKQIT